MGILYAIGAIGAALIGYALMGRRSDPAEPSRQLPAPAPPPSVPAWPDLGRPSQPAPGPISTAQPPGLPISPVHQPAGPPFSPAPPFPPFPPLPPLRTHDQPPVGKVITPPKMMEWSAALAPICVARKIMLPFALKWIDMESGGNPCAVGYPAAHGPDGMPLEVGIAQLYNPDDFGLISPRLTGAELRAYCVPGDQHAIVWKGKIIRGFSQAMTRPLRPDEIRRQADAAVALIAKAMRSATSDLVAIGAGSGWSTSSRDYWRLVKLQHGLPILSRQGLPKVTQLLGRPPANWAEFKASLGEVRFDEENERRYRSEIPRIVLNAETCASVVPTRDMG